jgi:hypothetical protein
MFFLLRIRAPWLQGLEEVITLIIHKDEGGEVLHIDLPDSLHTEFRILHALDTLDAALREHSSHTTNAAQIEATILLTSLGDDV